MRGQVLAFSQTDGAGVISGEDGARYGFHRDALNGATGVLAGSVVDFQVASGQATGIYVVSAAAVLSPKSRIAAGLLAWFLGMLGVHKFYLDKTNAGVIMLLCGTVGWFLILPGMAMWLIALIECFIYLVKSDEQFYQEYVVGNRQWF